MPNKPTYSYDPLVVLALAGKVLFGGKRSFRNDSTTLIGRIKPPLRVLGAENIPQAGPCLITFNHYYRPGFGAWWMALALAASVPAEIHFVMTGEWTFQGKWYAPLGRPLSHWLFTRVSKVYGFTTSPPMPPHPQDVLARAQSVRRVLEYARSHPQAVLGLAPEGGDQPGSVLSLPPTGSGRFMSLLAGMGYPLLPVGVYEENGNLYLSFGKAYILPAPRGGNSDDKDGEVTKTVMQHIAYQLPVRLRGEFPEKFP